MEVSQFEEVRAEFMNRIQQAVYCSVATVDPQGRPRSRVMHLIWDGPIGWVITWPESPKAKHLAHNPHVSLEYISQPYKPFMWNLRLNGRTRSAKNYESGNYISRSHLRWGLIPRPATE